MNNYLYSKKYHQSKYQFNNSKNERSSSKNRLAKYVNNELPKPSHIPLVKPPLSKKSAITDENLPPQLCPPRRQSSSKSLFGITNTRGRSNQRIFDNILTSEVKGKHVEPDKVSLYGIPPPRKLNKAVLKLACGVPNTYKKRNNVMSTRNGSKNLNKENVKAENMHCDFTYSEFHMVLFYYM